jgi:hypothetical protein
MGAYLLSGLFFHGENKKSPIDLPARSEIPLLTETLLPQHSLTVQALASQGGEIALDDTFVFDIACSNQRMMSPSLCGSDPYPCGSLTYRTL